MPNDQEFISLLLARLSLIPASEVPVAAMVVRDSQIISFAFNQREELNSILAHAEILALEAAAKQIGDWNLSGSTLYVSLEPCPMCAGAILQSHISRVVFSAYDLKAGAFGSKFNLKTNKIEIIGGILEEESQAILSNFFLGLRNKS